MVAKKSVPVKSDQRSVPATMEERRPRWPDPVDLFEEMQTDFMRFLGAPLGAWPFGRPLRRMPQMLATRTPRVDVYERNGNLVVKAEMPGVKKEDIDLSIEDGDLVLRAERREEREVKDENWYRMERSYGSFFRRLPLPENVQADRINASLTDGILEVTVPKLKEQVHEAKRIAIH